MSGLTRNRMALELGVGLTIRVEKMAVSRHQPPNGGIMLIESGHAELSKDN